MSDKKTVLVVDDEEMIRRVLQMLLEHQGYEVVLCCDGQEALDRVMTGEISYDLLLTDKRMPRMFGPELARRLRESGHRQPAILMTAEAWNLSGDLHGIDCVFQKPFPSNAALVAKIAELLTANTAT
jgi:CheY-like chemotaxis protein